MWEDDVPGFVQIAFGPELLEASDVHAGLGDLCYFSGWSSVKQSELEKPEHVA